MVWTLVTGAAKRLGRTLALELAKQGHHVVVHYNTSQQEAQAVAESCRKLGVSCEIIQGDFTTAESTAEFLARYLAQFPDTKYLVNNVGNYLTQTIGRTTEQDWREMFQSNVDVPFALTRALLPALKRHRGCIVNLGFAGSGHYLGEGKSAAYSIAKNALWMMTRFFAQELAPQGVRVNMVAPGSLENTVVKVDPRYMPMGRLGLLEEVARVVVFFLDDQNAYLTGQNVEVSGGSRL